LSERKKSTSGCGDSYKHPIPKRGAILDFLRHAGQPLKAEAVVKGFDLKGQRMCTRLLAQLQKNVNLVAIDGAFVYPKLSRGAVYISSAGIAAPELKPEPIEIR